MTIPAHVYAFVLSAICFVGAIVLTALNHPVPQELWSGGFLAAGAGAGIAIPSGTTPAAAPAAEHVAP